MAQPWEEEWKKAPRKKERKKQPMESGKTNMHAGAVAANLLSENETSNRIPKYEVLGVTDSRASICLFSWVVGSDRWTALSLTPPPKAGLIFHGFGTDWGTSRPQCTLPSSHGLAHAASRSSFRTKHGGQGGQRESVEMGLVAL